MDTYQYFSLTISAKYRLTDEGVEVETRRFGRLARTLVPFDQIPVHSSVTSWSSKPLLWAMIISAVLAVVVIVNLFVDSKAEAGAPLFYGIFCAVFGAAYFLTRGSSEVFIFQNAHVSFFRNAKNLPALTSFLHMLQRKKLDFFKKRIARALRKRRQMKSGVIFCI